jgi:hypothetical protein
VAKKTKRQMNTLAPAGLSSDALAANHKPEEMPGAIPSEFAAILGSALDEIEALIRRKIDGKTYQFGRQIADEVRTLSELAVVRLREIESRFAQSLPYEQPVEQNMSDHEHERQQQQSHAIFAEENPGKAHFTRKQWERTR